MLCFQVRGVFSLYFDLKALCSKYLDDFCQRCDEFSFDLHGKAFVLENSAEVHSSTTVTIVKEMYSIGMEAGENVVIKRDFRTELKV